MSERSQQTKRNQRMDLYKGLAIYFVVFIHVLFPGWVGESLRAVGRFAVPLFFLTAGYFNFGADVHALERRALRTLKLLVLGCIPYAVLGAALAVKQGTGLFAWLKGLFSLHVLKELLAFHTIPFAYAWQMWFLGALFTVYLWWWLMTGICSHKGRAVPYDALAAGAAVLLVIHLLLGEVSGLLGREVSNQVVRNALLDGLPFFALGAWAAYRRKTIRGLNVPWHWLVLGGAALSLLENKLAGKQELYLGTLILLAGLMGRCLRYRRAPQGKLSRALQICGGELTMYIFVLHMLVLAAVREVSWLGWLNGMTWLLPVVVAALSTLGALGLRRMKQALDRK